MTKKKEKEEQLESQRLQIHESWPQIISQDLKKKIIETFREDTSSNTLSTFTCAVCGEATLNSNQCKVPIGAVDLEILKWKKLDCGTSDSENIIQPPLPINDGPLKGIMLDPEGIVVDSDLDKIEDTQLLLCKNCSTGTGSGYWRDTRGFTRAIA